MKERELQQNFNAKFKSNQISDAMSRESQLLVSA